MWYQTDETNYGCFPTTLLHFRGRPRRKRARIRNDFDRSVTQPYDNSTPTHAKRKDKRLPHHGNVLNSPKYAIPAHRSSQLDKTDAYGPTRIKHATSCTNTIADGSDMTNATP